MRIPVEQKIISFENWITQFQTQIAELKPDSEEVESKLTLLQASLQKTLEDQAKQQSLQIHCQKQIASLRSQIESAADSEKARALEEKVKELDGELGKLKSQNTAAEVATQLKELQEQFLIFKASSEQVAKLNSGLRSQLQVMIDESDRQAQQFSKWQQEFSEQLTLQNKTQEAANIELQTQFSQIKMALSKRIAALEGRVENLETKYESLITKTDPAYTLAHKVIKLRQAVLKDEYINDELKYYVAPNGEAQAGSGDHLPLYEWVQENFLDTKTDTQVLLLQGQAGAGKSTFNRFLCRQLWHAKAWQTFEPGQPNPQAYLPIFIPLGSQQVNPKSLLKYLTSLPDLAEDLTEAEINILKRDYRLLIIADGYDEIPGNPNINLYDVNQFDKYSNRFKLLISCRSTRGQELNETDYFIPHDRTDKPRFANFKRRFISPFDDKQIASYLEKFLAAEKGRTDIILWPDVKTYQEKIESLPDLKKLIDTPFLLMITVEVLPEIVMEIESSRKDSKTTEILQLTRAKLYDRFMENWFKRQMNKARQAGDLPSRGDITKLYQQFCIKLAECLHEAKITAVQYPWEEEDLFATSTETHEDTKGPRGPWVKQLFGDKDSRIIQARKGSPLKITTKNYYQFIHASLIDYFLTTTIWQQTKLTTLPKSFVPIKSDVGSPDVKSIQVSPPIPIPTLVATKPDIDPIGPISELDAESSEQLMRRQLMTFDQWSFLADRVKHDSLFKTYLFSLIERSKTDESFALIAANAISILNIAEVSFSDLNFQGIRIPGADLSQAILDNTNLQGADLSDVNLQWAWLRNANLSGALLTELRLGEWPSIKWPDGISHCAYSDDYHWLALGSYNQIEIYEVSSWQFRHKVNVTKMRDKHGSLTSIAIDSQGKYLATGQNDGSVHVWNVTTGIIEQTSEQTFSDPYSNRYKGITQIKFDPKGERLASISFHKPIYLWNRVKGSVERTIEQDAKCIAFDPKGELLASGGGDEKSYNKSRIHLWNVATGELIRSFEVDIYGIKNIAFDPTGEHLAACGSKTPILYNVSTGQIERMLEGHSDTVTNVNFDRTGEHLATTGGSNDKTIRIWNTLTGRCEQVLEGNDEKIIFAIFDPAGKRLISASDSYSNGSKVRFSDITVTKMRMSQSGHNKQVVSVAFDSKQNQVASSGEDGTICLWDAVTGKGMHSIKDREYNDAFFKLTVDPKGLYLASDCGPGNLLLLNLKTKEEKIINGHLRSSTSMVFHPREDYLISAGEHGIRFLNLITEKCDHIFETKDKNAKRLAVDSNGVDVMAAYGIAIDAKGERLAAAAGEVVVWSLKTWNKEQTFKLAYVTPLCVAFDPSGKRLASGSIDKNVRLWNLLIGKLERTLEGHTSDVTDVAFAPNQHRLASASKDNTVRLWNYRTGTCLSVIQGFTGAVNSLAWCQTEKGNFIVTGGADKAVRSWQIMEEEKEQLRIVLNWTSHQTILTAAGTRLEGARDLNAINLQLLKQRGADDKSPEIKAIEIKDSKNSNDSKEIQEIKGATSPEYTVVTKLRKMRQAILDDPQITNALAFYIPPNAQSNPMANDALPLYEWMVREFLNGEAQVLLLQGPAGAGKSTFNRYLLRQLWQDDEWWEGFKLNDPLPKITIPIFITLNSTQIDPTNLFEYLRNLPKSMDNFTDAEINVLKRDYSLLFIVDDYDEAPLFDATQMSQYKSGVKFLISCDANSFTSQSKTEYQQFKIRHLSPFDSKQIGGYLEKYVQKNKERTDIKSWPDVITFQKYIASQPTLKKLISTPLLLMMTMEILPQIMEETERSPKTEITQLKIYDKFVEKRVVPDGHQFCVKLAEHFWQDRIMSIRYPLSKDPKGPQELWVEKLFGSSNSRITQARTNCSLLSSSGNFQLFIHALLIDYLLTTSIYQLAKTSDIIAFKKSDLKDQKDSIKSTTTLEAKQISELSPQSPEVLMRLQLMTKNQWYFLAERVKEDVIFKEYLLALIGKSKIDETYTMAAANAISILNAAEINLVDLDFSKVRIPHADLSGGVLDSVNFSEADLSHVNFSGAWLRCNNFSKAKMHQAQFFKTDKKLRLLKGHNDPIVSIDLDTKGGLLASASREIIHIWDLATGKEIRTIQWSASTFVSMVRQDGYSAPRRVEYTKMGHLNCVTFDSTGKYLAAGMSDNRTRIWEVASGEEKHCFDNDSGFSQYGTTRVTIDPNGKYIASISEYKIELWDLATGKNLCCYWDRTFGRDHCRLYSNIKQADEILFDPQGKYLAAVGRPETESQGIHVWDIESGFKIFTVRPDKKSDVSDTLDSIVYDAKGERIAAVNRIQKPDNEVIRLWHIETGKEVGSIKIHPTKVRTIRFDEKDDSILLSSNYDQTIRGWNISKGHCAFILSLPTMHNAIGSSVWKDVGFDKYVVIRSDDAIACFKWQQKKSELTAALHWVAVKGSKLEVYGANIENALGLQSNDIELLKQKGAVVMPLLLEAKTQSASTSPAKKSSSSATVSQSKVPAHLEKMPAASKQQDTSRQVTKHLSARPKSAATTTHHSRTSTTASTPKGAHEKKSEPASAKKAALNTKHAPTAKPTSSLSSASASQSHGRLFASHSSIATSRPKSATAGKSPTAKQKSSLAQSVAQAHQQIFQSASTAATSASTELDDATTDISTTNSSTVLESDITF